VQVDGEGGEQDFNLRAIANMDLLLFPPDDFLKCIG
jgi:hypothetical protein